MKFVIDYVTLARAIEATEFAIEECKNRILEAIAQGNNRTAGAWRLTIREHETNLNDLKNARRHVSELY